MSRNIIIKIDGVDQSLSAVEDIQTDRASGGSVKWVTPEEKTLAEISCTQNKNYTAQEAGAYGIGKATVNVPPKYVTGKGEDGQTHHYGVDDEGHLTDQVLPESIAVTTPPYNPYVIYSNGQAITKDGMVVHAYYLDGSDYGEVNIADVTISPTTAVYDEATDMPGYKTVSSDLETNWEQPIRVLKGFKMRWILGPDGYGRTGERYEEYYFPNMLIWFGTYNRYLNMSVLSTQSGYVEGYYYQKVRQPGDTTWSESSGTISAACVNVGPTINDLTVYFSSSEWLGRPEWIAPTPEPINPDRNTMWTALYGDVDSDVGTGSHQIINVYWPRDVDGKVLETTFEILVAPPYNQDDNSFPDGGDQNG